MRQFVLSRRAVLAGAAAIGFAPGGIAQTRRRLMVETRSLDIAGKSATVYGIRNDAGGQGLELDASERFLMSVENRIGYPTVLHWHGLTPPSDQDGVPHVSQEPIPRGGAHDYDFGELRAGTHWMHSHLDLQEQHLLAAPLIVRDRSEAGGDEQEHVVMLHDFTFRDPAEILAELQSGGGLHAGHSAMDHSQVDMNSVPSAINDVAFDAYLANDRTVEDPEIVHVEKGGRMRLRIINGAAASNFWIDLGALEGELIAVDGNAVVPVKGRMFPLAIAQRADVRLTLPAVSSTFPVLFRVEGSDSISAIVLTTGAPVGKLAVKASEAAPALTSEFETGLVAINPLPVPEGMRSEMLHLGGGGADYRWSLNGKSGMHDQLFAVRPGERMEIAIMNMTSMGHPMHLHGHHFQVVGLRGGRVAGAMRDTVFVPPMETVVIAFDADNPGTWAFHCHHLYHMNSGMMGTLAYVSAA